jgi:proteasome alpha subunit
MMGYDRAITMFSPDGRLLQVEYAKKTVRQGSTAIGMVCKDGVVLVTDKRIVDKLIVADAVEKIWQVDNHIAITAAGILSDARVLVERAQLKAQENKVTYDSPIDILTVVRDLANIKQMCTQSGGLRPFGVSLLIAGADETGLKLFETDPTGIYFQYKATAIGEGELEVKNILTKEYKETLTVDEGIKLAVSALKKVVTDGFEADRIDCVFITADKKSYEKVTREKIAKILSLLDGKEGKDSGKDSKDSGKDSGSSKKSKN